MGRVLDGGRVVPVTARDALALANRLEMMERSGVGLRTALAVLAWGVIRGGRQALVEGFRLAERVDAGLRLSGSHRSLVEAEKNAWKAALTAYEESWIRHLRNHGRSASLVADRLEAAVEAQEYM